MQRLADWLRELLIALERRRMNRAAALGYQGEMRDHFEAMRKLISKRSPAQVERRERKLGLR